MTKVIIYTGRSFFVKKPVYLRAVSIALALLLFSACLPMRSSAVVIESVTTGTGTNSAPVAEDIEIRTYKNVCVKAYFNSTDPDGDQVSYRLESEPAKGTVDIKDNTFLYMPKEGKKGKDSFTYAAVDSQGNVSGKATVSIVIDKMKCKVTYADISSNEPAYAAYRLAEESIYTGGRISESYYFKPDEIVSRGEFLALCMSAASVEPLKDILRTGFADDASMPFWVKPYVSAALLDGVISGYADANGAIVFSADSAISGSEAAVMLNNMLGITDVASVSSFRYSDSVPAWALQALVNLDMCNIISDVQDTVGSGYLTRIEAAEMISRALDFIETRKKDGSLLGWVK